MLLSSDGGRWTLRIYVIVNPAAGFPVARTVPRSRIPAASTIEGPEKRNTHVSRVLASSCPSFLFSAVGFSRLVFERLSFCVASWDTGKHVSDTTASSRRPAPNSPLVHFLLHRNIFDFTPSKGTNLLAASVAINAVSRVLTDYVDDRLGRQNTLILTLLLAASSIFAFWLSSALITTSSSTSLWLAFIVFYSFSAGGHYGLFPALITEVFGIR